MSAPHKFSLFKRPNGIWYVVYQEDGRRCWKSTRCSKKADALKAISNLEKLFTSKPKFTLMSAFWKEYSQYSRTVHTEKTRETYETASREFQKIVGDLLLVKIGVREIERFIAVKTKEASEWTARKYYIALASMFETARRWELISVNPFRLVKKPKVREVYPVFFSKAVFQKLLSVVEDVDFRELCITAIATGLRFGELSALEWDDVDFDRKLITVQNKEWFTTKTRRNRCIPISEFLYRLLLSREQRKSCSFVFHRNNLQLRKNYVSFKFKRYVRKAELDDRLHFHSLRHSTATFLVQACVPIYSVQKILGHSSITTTQVYSHLRTEELHDSLNRIDYLLT